MLIGIDASRATITQRTGTEGYSLHIIRGLLAQGSEHRFRLYFRDTPPDELFPCQDNIEYRVIKRQRLWTHRGLGPAVRREKPDILFVPAHVIPWPNVGGVPSVVTTHDLGYLHYPSKHPFLERLHLNWSTRHSTRIARRVIAVSQATASDLIALNGVQESKIRVVHSGVDETLKPVQDQKKIAELKERLKIPGPYILHVGSIQARKNLQRLVDAFDQIKDEHPDISLVLAGRAGWGYERLVEHIQQSQGGDRVILPGYIPDDDLPTLYSGARVYAFPSLYEGFGFPALEAMACNAPVICANTSSLPELVNDAALTVAPTDVNGLAEALRRVLCDPELREDLIKRGAERVKSFTWEASAWATMIVLEEAAGIRR